jgi:hypothetical protein
MGCTRSEQSVTLPVGGAFVHEEASDLPSVSGRQLFDG